MSKLQTREAIARQAVVHAVPPASAHQTDRSFELPPRLYLATVGCYLGFLGIMAAGLGNPGLVIPMAIFVFFIVAGFSLPLIWTRMAPANPVRPMSWAQLARDGVATHTGRVTVGDATVQVLILPVLILSWGGAIVTIAALVR